MADQVVRARYEAEVSGYTKGMQEAAKATDELAKSADKAEQATQKSGDAAAKSADKTAQAQKKAADAQDKAADAAGKLRVAQQKLDDARASGNTTRIVQAEENLASAQREVERTARDAGAAQDALQAELDATGEKAEQSSTRMGRLSDAIRDNRADMEQAGQGLTIMGAGLTAAAGATGKFAMDWESAWAGVMKTNDGTAEQTQKLEAELRSLATDTLPATHAEIAAVAEAAGQLGVGIDDVAGFTETMVNLGETTNLSAEEAATSLARFSNIMGTSFSDADKLGSTIVGLGNNFATTEAEILGMSMRVAAVGKQMGMTEADVMALSTAMSSVGIEAEAGGTAISMTMKNIDKSVREGGESLTGWAEAAGVSAEEFAEAWRNDPAQAMVLVTEGLGAAGAAGEDVNAILSDLGVKGIRESDTMLRLASSSGLLAEALGLAAEELDSNSALAAEAAVRYETTEAKISMAWNNIKDAAIDAGAVLLPVIATIADGVADLAGFFGDLPGPVQGGLTAIAGVAGVTALAAGALLTLAPRVMDTVDAMRNLGATGPKARGAIKGLGIAGGVAVGVTALLTGLTALYNSTKDATPGVEELANALAGLRESGDVGDIDEKFQFDSVTTQINGFVDALDHIDLSNPVRHIQSFGDTVFGMENPMSQARDAFAALDQTLSVMDLSKASDSMNQLRQEAEAAGRMDLSSWSELQQVLPEYTASVEAAAEATYGHVEAADLFQIAMGNVPGHLQAVAEGGEAAGDGAAAAGEGVGVLGEAAEETEESLSDVVERLQALGVITRNTHEATGAAAQSVRDLAASVKENGNSLDVTTEKGYANVQAMHGVADSYWTLAEANAEAGEAQHVLRGNLEDGYDALVNQITAMTGNEDAARRMAREIMGIPPDVKVDTWMDETAHEIATNTGQAVDQIPEGINILSSMDDKAAQQAFKTAESIKLIPGHKKVDVAVSDNGTPGQIQSHINAITGKTEYVFVTDDGTVNVTQQKITGIDGKTEYVYVTDDGTVVATQGSINNIQGKTVPVTAEAHTGTAEGQLNHAARDRHTRIIARVVGNTGVQTGHRPNISRPGGYMGGVVGQDFGLPRLATGGRLPYTGLGTDMILGLSSAGRPTALVDDGEWVIRESSARRYNRLLGLINSDDPSVRHLAGYANGGTVGREWTAGSTGSMPSFPSSLSATVDASVIGSAVESALSRYQPVVRIGKREFYGVMQEAQAYGGSR